MNVYLFEIPHSAYAALGMTAIHSKREVAAAAVKDFSLRSKQACRRRF
jgi:hypothetical protein